MAQPRQSRWQPTRRQLLWTGGIVVVVAAAVLIGYRYDITLWDWLKLLIVPVVIAGGGIWFNRQQRERELESARQQREQELESAERRAQNEALQAYLDQMSGMLIPNQDQSSLYKARPGDGLSSVARARTLTVLPRLDGERKARVVQFLYESRLIDQERILLDAESELIEKRHNIISLQQADLQMADLQLADLFEANLSEALLSEADLRGADLSRANLSGADLSGADLNRAVLRDIRGWTEDQLRAASSLEGTTMPDGQSPREDETPNDRKYEDWLKDRERRKEGAENE